MTMFSKSEPWQITTARFCVSLPNGFTYEEVREFTKKLGISDGHFSQFFEEEIQTPAGRQFSRTERGGKWMPPTDLVSKVTDFDELREARNNAFWAQIFSILSLVVASVSLILQFLKN